VIATSPAYHDHPLQRLLQNFPHTTPVGSARDPHIAGSGILSGDPKVAGTSAINSGS
jgi:hypothetical protein